jgi:hypothetical protein
LLLQLYPAAVVKELLLMAVFETVLKTAFGERMWELRLGERGARSNDRLLISECRFLRFYAHVRLYQV